MRSAWGGPPPAHLETHAAVCASTVRSSRRPTAAPAEPWVVLGDELDSVSGGETPVWLVGASFCSSRTCSFSKKSESWVTHTVHHDQLSLVLVAGLLRNLSAPRPAFVPRSGGAFHLLTSHQPLPSTFLFTRVPRTATAL